MTDFRMGSRMCDYCQRNLPSGDLCGCKGEKEARFRWMDKLIREDVNDLPPVGSQRERQLAAILAIAIDDHDSSVGCSMKEAHWTNKARALLATPATTVDETKRLREALETIVGGRKSEAGTWAAMVEPLVGRFDVAANFGGEAVYNAEGSTALAELLRQMAFRLDRSVEAANAALGGAFVVPDDVCRLVVAARIVAFESQDKDALKELDEASEAFASRVPWDDEPDAALSDRPQAEGERQ